ncbi:hypothetical protein AC792_10855 [Arthrobacter sp. RIT-PI-e]|uniref:beta-L-arabinofuranosidase domain-containing protein n=1 Tax=Arthrobacter sp. RIT-PI-e TaxID=1681197 RepID=UPI000675DA51|nr:beta-L-arabinofuranosidase domain-containing protein [Arthrobacter sp. RIT-PI-e]KNC18646.1 hypothetical protein AC792_10855 [Arthrobacter sp. RIT-PI-e]
MTSATSTRAEPAVTATTSFPLDAVRLLDGDFRAAQATSIRYVLQLDADRLLAPYRREAGLEQVAEPYGSWESDGMDGHVGGHYLSALAQLYAATGDERLLERLDHVVRELGRCQATGTGFVGGVPGGQALGEELAAGRVDADLFTLNGRWVPLYNLHKTLAGLLDASTHASSTAALAIAGRLADWWMDASRSVPEDVFEQILHTEFGGMQDAFTQLAEATGNTAYLEEARRFTHRSILEPLAEGRDALDGLHANTQIPKVVGYERFGALTGEAAYGRAADVFWDTVVTHRTVSIGGNSVREHFQPAADFTSMVQDVQGPETCNTYNMLKLAKLRFEHTGARAAVEFYERATYNHILSTQHPEHGGLVYFTPMRPGHYRVYSEVQESMWCCVGSGLENHARYGELVYSHRGEDLLVNLYLASDLTWEERGLHVRMETDLPRSDTATLSVTASAPTDASLLLRRPSWAQGMRIDVGGKTVSAEPDADGYVRLHRTWEGTTSVTVRFGLGFHAEALPDGSPWVSYLYGPVVLACRTGQEDVPGFRATDERMGHVAAGPLLPLAATPVVTAADPLDAVVLGDRASLTAHLTATVDGEPRTFALEPFAGIHDERYTVYWPTGAEAERTAELRAMDLRAADAERVIDVVAAGEQQPEADHGFRGEATRAAGSDGEHWRNATGWFSYTLKDPDHRATVLRVRTRAAATQQHELRLNGTPLGEALRVDPDGGQESSYYRVDDALRAGGAPGHLVLSVHAPTGGSTGDVVSVALLREM